MPVIYHPNITDELMSNNLDWLFLFGDNYERVGFGGQAKVMRGKPNGHGIRTKHYPTMKPDAFLNDKYLSQYIAWWCEDFLLPFQYAVEGDTIVIPVAGLGTGLARVPECAPKSYQVLQEFVLLLEHLGMEFFNDNNN